MKKLLYIFALVLCSTGNVQAQQLPQYSQYVLNSYAINPAVAGTSPWYNVFSNHRYQWAGITDAPRTYTLSVYGPSSRFKNVGLGAYLFTDHVGPTRRTGIQLSYSYQLKLTESLNLSMGLSAGLLQFMVDAGKITLHESDDPVWSTGLQSDVVPDAKFGLYLYHDDFYVGASMPQIAQNKLLFFQQADNSLSKLEDHYFLAAGYRYEVFKGFVAEPSLIAKYVNPAPMQFDFTLRLMYKNQVWLGGSYRTEDALAAMVGYSWKETISIAYAYDYSTSNLRNYTTGTHEIMLGIKFKSPNKKQKKPEQQPITNQ